MRRTALFAVPLFALLLSPLPSHGRAGAGEGTGIYAPLPDLRAFLGSARELPVPAFTPEAVRTLSAVEGPAQARPFTLPSKFTMHERFFSITDSFDIKKDGKLLGRVTGKILALSRSFKLEDAAGNRVADARARIFTLGARVDVADPAGRPVGAFKEQLLKSLFKVHTTYSVFDAADKEILVSEKLDLFSTEFKLYAKDGRLVATVKRDFLTNLFRFTDLWEVELKDAAAVDHRVLVMIAAYKSSVDNARRAEESSRDSD